jgi:hypothetical protein
VLGESILNQPVNNKTMSKILIENYRGFDIEFDVHYEKFQCECEDGKAKESQSFSAVKKFIDDFKKANQDFKPFYVETNPTNPYGGKKLKVIGLRKDGRFIGEDEKGNKDQISDYHLKGFMILKPENEVFLNQLQDLKAKEEIQKAENKEIRDNIISKLNIVTLEDYKKSLE